MKVTWLNICVRRGVKISTAVLRILSGILSSPCALSGETIEIALRTSCAVIGTHPSFAGTQHKLSISSRSASGNLEKTTSYSASAVLTVSSASIPSSFSISGMNAALRLPLLCVHCASDQRSFSRTSASFAMCVSVRREDVVLAVALDDLEVKQVFPVPSLTISAASA